MQPQTEGSEDVVHDRDALFARIAQEHASFLYRVAYSLLRHAQDAEDAVQDALLKLYRGFGEQRWSAVQDERAFLARVVWRAALDRRAVRGAGVEDESAVLRVIDVRPTPERVAAEQDERALLQEWINALPEELRQPLLLSAMDAMSSREIGAVMGLPEGTVRTRLMRARTLLKQRHEAMCGEMALERSGR